MALHDIRTRTDSERLDHLQRFASIGWTAKELESAMAQILRAGRVPMLKIVRFLRDRQLGEAAAGSTIDGRALASN